MPIYEYNCKACGHVFETMQKVSDPPPSGCLQCESADVSRLVSATNFKLKGTGWYATDFKDKSKEPAQTNPKDSEVSKKEGKDTKGSKDDKAGNGTEKSASKDKETKTNSE